ncbi:ribosomal protein S18 [Lepidopterella palustris CBS 459.81]|uniref:Small ribosomal subunit protein bS18m n=1 Tax=Lepidopterella palustris CBS 459.81 TaxID=1314670 RepID=A0A8E2EGS0_9PEZI|nr:ribosomal protein S18 [Lepidopterella palustris CBS 459.81]
MSGKQKPARSVADFAKEAFRSTKQSTVAARAVSAAQLEQSMKRGQFEQQMWRKWKSGDVYAPHDLTGSEQAKWKRTKTTPKMDAFDVLKLNPINEYKNFSIMSEYMTEMGRIKHSSVTGLRPVNQRKIAKAIRRAIGIGLMPSVHRHPELLIRSKYNRFN